LSACLLVTVSSSRAQDREPPPLQLNGGVPEGGRSTATASWGTFSFEVINITDKDRPARVLLFYKGQPDVQYGRDVWVPAHSTVKSWLLVGPAPDEEPPPGKQPAAEPNFLAAEDPAAGDKLPGHREVEVLLYDRSEEKPRLILPPGTERIRSRLVSYLQRSPKQPFTAVVLDEEPAEDTGFERLPQPPSRKEEALRFIRAFRAARKLSDFVQTLHPGPLPPTPETFAGVDHLVLASNRLASDPGGLEALRRWLERGGTVWVMLDLVDPEVYAPLLGAAYDFRVVDRVGLTSFRVEAPPTGQLRAEAPLQQHDQPVELVRVLLPPQEQAPHTVNGWPAWFTRPVGRGKVIFTALGPRGWPAPGEAATGPMDALSGVLQPPPQEDPIPVEALQTSLNEEIGYSVVGRGTVIAIFAAFLLATLALGLVLRRSRRPELLGWLGPAAALGAAAALLALGAWSRRAASPTLAVAQVVDTVAGTDEAAVHGLLAEYRPDSGPADVGAVAGGLFELDMSGIEGRTRRLILTDVGAWHWENLALPAGVRFAPFRYTARTGTPLGAAAHFGAEGLEGRLTTGPFQGVGDAVLAAPDGRNMAVHLGADGAFTAKGSDVLPPGEFLTGTVLNDRQQRRQELYRTFLKPPRDDRFEGRFGGRTMLLAWADPIDMHFTLAPDARTVGTALLTMPLRLERSPPGAAVTIPGPFIPYRRILNALPARPTVVSNAGVDQDLRFQLPQAVLPFKVERARLVARIDAPSRRVTVAGQADGKPVEVHRVESPIDPIRVEITAEPLLRLDETGSLHLNLTISDTLQGGQGEKWTIRSLDLEVSGRTE
jgi:hypothetical protein